MFCVLEGMDTQSTTLASLRALSSSASTALSSTPWWRKPLVQVLNQLFQRPLPQRKSVNVTPVPRRAARASPAPASSDRPMGMINGGESGGIGAREVQKGVRVLRENGSGPYGLSWLRPSAP
jgi:hypothetical protein